MPAQTSTTPQPDHGAALILGGVLGLLLASSAAVAVGGWQVWQTEVAGSSTISASAPTPTPLVAPQARRTVSGQPPNPYPSYVASPYNASKNSAYSSYPASSAPSENATLSPSPANGPYSGGSNTGYGSSGYGNSGYGNSGYGNSGYGNSGVPATNTSPEPRDQPATPHPVETTTGQE